MLRICRALRWGKTLEVTFYGAPAHQVGEGEVQGAGRGEVGLELGSAPATHLREQLGTLTAHRPSPGPLRQRIKGGEGEVW